MQETEIMKAKEVADYLHLHLFTVHKLAREGSIPAFKIGNDWRFRRTLLQKWIKNREKINHKKNFHNNSPKH